jgi:aspartokinase/homoserine dehydrogenase 1
MRILKFGGSSVGTPARISNVIDILAGYRDKKIKFGVVFSAFQGVTDKLIEVSQKAVVKTNSYKYELAHIRQIHFDAVAELLINKNDKDLLVNKVTVLLSELEEILHGIYLVKELTPRTLDYVMSFGERLSCTIISDVMNCRGFETEFLDARLVVKTDNTFGASKVNFKLTDKNIADYFKTHKKIQVITGFIGSNDKNVTTTLGRGGSDYSAAIFGAALDSEIIEIWTDVDGILTADPRRVVNAFSLKAVTYEEAMELSHFGAKVIHPPTMKPALNKKIKIKIKNTFNPGHDGTLITDKDHSDHGFSVKGISSIDDVNLLRVSGSGMVGVIGTASRIFSALARNSVNVILITQASSEHSICLAVLPKDGLRAKAAIEEEFKWEIKDKVIDEVVIESNMSVIAVVGEDMRHTPGISGKVFQSLGKNGINISAIAQGSSELNISLVIQKDYLKKAMNVLHDSLFLSKEKTLNVFIIGAGHVGGSFLDLLSKGKIYMINNVHVKVRVAGIANIYKMIFDEKGINLKKWRSLLESSKTETDVQQFIDKVKQMNLPDSILVDCTAGMNVVKNYPAILSSSISIVTPNKIANSQKYPFYNSLRELAKEHNVQFRYRTNVGAALPIINTLRDLISSGDEIVKIEGVLSGTLSYIFNTLRDRDSFSEIVKEAKERGFTEPDPRDDLNGLDMARKLLILIRETGLPFELSDIKIEKLISSSAERALSVENFFEVLKKDDAKFVKMKEAAAKKGNSLCYIATFEKGKAVISVQEIGKEHPFSNLTLSDNIVAFTTKRYCNTPLTIKGPGAGGEITGSGILSDVLTISNYLS